MEKTNKMEETKETQESLQRKREQALQRLRKERTEEALWDCVTAYQDFEFHTYSGLPYSYHMKYGRSGTYTKELWIDRREKSKSLVWSSVRSAYQKVLELPDQPRLHHAPIRVERLGLMLESKHSILTVTEIPYRIQNIWNARCKSL